MKVFARAALVFFAVYAMTASSSFSQQSTSSAAQYSVELYRGISPPSDDLVIGRIVWELKDKKGTLQEAMNDDLKKRMNIYVRGSYKVNDTHRYLFIGGEKELSRVEMYKLDNDIWVMEKPEWLLSYFGDSLGGVGSTMNGFLTIFSK
jgi:hypothetical protein